MTAARRRRPRGFTYLSLIILVAIIGLVAAATLKLGAVIQRSRAEQQLLDIGAAFSDALQSYADATPPGMSPQPRSLNDLLRDPRLPGLRRHLRQIYVDPMTGKAEWGIVYLGEKAGVLAVYSLSDAKPVKISNFPPRFAGLAGKQKISDWRFAAMRKEENGAMPAAAVASPATPATATAPVPPAEAPMPAPTATPPEPPPPGEPQVEQPPEPPEETRKD